MFILYCILHMMNTTIMSPINYKVESEKQKFGLRLFLSTIIFVSTALFIGSALVILDRKQFSEWTSNDAVKGKIFKPCDETQHRPHGSEPLPRGIVSPTSDLELLPLWGLRKKNLKKERNLLAIAVGIKQKENVNKIVNKFLSSDRNFVVMLFHYDGLVDGWRDFEWSHKAIHTSAINQTKWWFGKRFLHPDIVSEYEYIFLWDEDLGVDNFDPGRYLSIIKEEGLQISQPALDPNRSEVHHHLTKRQYGSRVHRRIAGKIGGTMCDENAAGPPCSGFVEMMAPVFSKASWRCTWYMIQNDLVQGWGLDFHLGYCAQGDRSKNVGIVDSQYIVHYGLPTLGGSETKAQLLLRQSQDRHTVKQWSLVELEIFKNRWKKAAKDDDCWADPYKQS